MSDPTEGSRSVSEPQPRKRKAAAPQAVRRVKATVLLDVGTHARLAAAAALRGLDRSTYAAELISHGLRGVVAFDKKLNVAGQGDPASEEDRADVG